jgi:hypothetical protein
MGVFLKKYLFVHPDRRRVRDSRRKSLFASFSSEKEESSLSPR